MVYDAPLLVQGDVAAGGGAPRDGVPPLGAPGVAAAQAARVPHPRATAVPLIPSLEGPTVLAPEVGARAEAAQAPARGGGGVTRGDQPAEVEVLLVAAVVP